MRGEEQSRQELERCEQLTGNALASDDYADLGWGEDSKSGCCGSEWVRASWGKGDHMACVSRAYDDGGNMEKFPLGAE